MLATVGVSTTDAITMFLRQVVLRNGLPFEVRVPNAATRKAIEELENSGARSKLKRYATADEMFGDVAPYACKSLAADAITATLVYWPVPVEPRPR